MIIFVSPVHSLDELDAEPEPDLKPVKKVQPSRTNTANTDQKRTDSTKLLRCELSRITQKAPSHMHLNKVCDIRYNDTMMIMIQYGQIYHPKTTIQSIYRQWMVWV